MSLYESAQQRRRDFLMSKKTVAAITKRETNKAKVTTKPAVTKAQEKKADNAGGSKPA